MSGIGLKPISAKVRTFLPENVLLVVAAIEANHNMSWRDGLKLALMG